MLIDQASGAVLLADYFYGIISVRIICTKAFCIMIPIHSLDYSTATKLETPNLNQVKSFNTVFLQLLSPLMLIEINIEQSCNLYEQSSFRLPDDDKYQGLQIIDANEQYIGVILLSLSQYEPVVRIYDRQSNFFSIG